MTKKIIILIIVVLALVAFFVVNNDGTSTSPEPLPGMSKDVAWNLFQEYLGYNKNLNLEGVKSVVYKISPICKDPKDTVSCQSRMNLAYQYGSALKKEDFTNVWSDSKQTILSTDFIVEKNEELGVMSRGRAIIFFVKNESGDLKLLSFTPLQGSVTNISSASQEELDYRVVRYTEDKDEDGVADYEEECLHTKEGESCMKTDPKIRDTDGDGWWDGVEVFLNSQ